MNTLTRLGFGPMGQLAVRPARGDSASTLVLPPVSSSGGLPLMEALQQRRSQREFANTALPEQMLGDLLWAAYGVNRPALGGRTAPRAMTYQEIDVYVALPAGLYRYEPAGHVLCLEVRRDVRDVTGNQDFTAEAALDLVFVADDSRVQLVQGGQREDYAYTTAGAMAQNVYLYSASYGLATVLRAWIDRGALRAAMELGVDQQVLLAQTVGYPKSNPVA
ncbi:MAG: SagB/ThcOx family dehydrogenase [Pseudomonadota bacterium]|nr:SagB/ThcOx family dehydrogenase [Pseudomonadota bacterium]